MSTGAGMNVETKSRDWEVDVASFVRFLNAQPGWEASPRQARLMLDLLLHLASHGELREPEDLASWLAPVFCKTPEDQAKFPEVYRRWENRHADSIPEDGDEKTPQPKGKVGANYTRLAMVGLVCLVLLSTLFLVRIPEVAPKFVEDSRRPPAPYTPSGVNSDQAEEQSVSSHRPGSRTVVRKLTSIPPVKVPVWPLWPWIVFPISVVLLRRLYRWWSEKAVIQRIRTQEEVEEDRFRLPNDDIDFLPNLKMGETARGLRVKEWARSSKLDVDATIRRSMLHPEAFEPVCLAEVEREYLFLIDRTYSGDHQTELARTLKQHFADFGVRIDAYTFRSDPTYCTQEKEYPDAEVDDVRLNVLLDRHPDHRVVLLCTTEVFFDNLTGQRKPWIDILAEREDKVVLTPDPVKEWGRREIIIERQGFRVLPMTPEGMALFRDTFADRRPEELEDWQRLDSLHEETLESDRWLERGAPSQAATERLMRELERQLGETGMLWLGAIAVYPQLHWGLTLRLGANLLSSGDFQRLLPRISHMIWFRHSYMPDWLRAQLIEHLQRTDPHLEMQVRDLLMQILRDLEQADEEYQLPLRVKLEQSEDVRTRIGNWADQFRRIAKKARLFKDKGLPFGSNPYRDVVFLKFVSRPRLGTLSLNVPDSLLRVLYPKGLAVYGFRTGTLVLSFLVIALFTYWQFGFGANPHAIADFQFAPATGVLVSQAETGRTLIQNAVPSNPKPGDVRFDNALGMTFVWCPPGEFIMGSPADEVDRKDNEPQIGVRMSDGFWMGQTEVTRAQWNAVMGTKPRVGDILTRSGPRSPLVNVTWEEADQFCARLTRVEHDAGRLQPDWSYHLPTEAQWEYACRAGTQTRFSFGNKNTEVAHNAWFILNSSDGDFAHPVAQKPSNPWGLFDMHGNLAEWCYDGYMSRLPGGTDPVVAHSVSSERVLRGGSWFSSADLLRSASREHNAPRLRSHSIGFRCVRSRDEVGLLGSRIVEPVRPEADE